MSTTIYSGESQIRVSLKYNETADAEVYGQQIDQMLKKGVYNIPDSFITINSNTQITVKPFTVVIRSEGTSYIDSSTEAIRVADISVKATTKVDAVLTALSYAKPYIVAELWSPQDVAVGYKQDVNLTIRVRDVSAAERNESTQVLLGRLKYRDNSGTKDELYEVDVTNTIKKSPLYEAETWLGEFKAAPAGGKSITVFGGNLEGNIIPSITATYTIGGAHPYPTIGYHRYDIYYVDENNDIVWSNGNEQVDTGGDEWPKPTNRPLTSSYPFPVSIVYVPSNIRTRDFDESDIENVIPRFTRKPSDTKQPIADYVISNVEMFINYFGDDTETNQNGFTTGLLEDGFPCEWVEVDGVKVKTVYPRRGRYEIANNYDRITGEIIRYPLYSRLKLPSGFQLVTGNDVVIEYMSATAGIEITNDTDVLIDGIDPIDNRVIETFEEDLYVADRYSERFGEYLHPEDWTSLSLSDSVKRENNYTENLSPSTTKKGINIEPGNIDVTSFGTTSTESVTIERGDFVYRAYIASSVVYVSKYSLESTGLVVDTVWSAPTNLGTFTTPTQLQISFNDTTEQVVLTHYVSGPEMRVHVLNSETGAVVVNDNITSFPTTFTNYSHVTLQETGINTIYFVGVDSSNNIKTTTVEYTTTASAATTPATIVASSNSIEVSIHHLDGTTYISCNNATLIKVYEFDGTPVPITGDPVGSGYSALWSFNSEEHIENLPYLPDTLILVYYKNGTDLMYSRLIDGSFETPTLVGVSVAGHISINTNHRNEFRYRDAINVLSNSTLYLKINNGWESYVDPATSSTNIIISDNSYIYTRYADSYKKLKYNMKFTLSRSVVDITTSTLKIAPDFAEILEFKLRAYTVFTVNSLVNIQNLVNSAMEVVLVDGSGKFRNIAEDNYKGYGNTIKVTSKPNHQFDWVFFKIHNSFLEFVVSKPVTFVGETLYYKIFFDTFNNLYKGFINSRILNTTGDFFVEIQEFRSSEDDWFETSDGDVLNVLT